MESAAAADEEEEEQRAATDIQAQKKARGGDWRWRELQAADGGPQSACCPLLLAFSPSLQYSQPRVSLCLSPSSPLCDSPPPFACVCDLLSRLFYLYPSRLSPPCFAPSPIDTCHNKHPLSAPEPPPALRSSPQESRLARRAGSAASPKVSPHLETPRLFFNINRPPPSPPPHLPLPPPSLLPPHCAAKHPLILRHRQGPLLRPPGFLLLFLPSPPRLMPAKPLCVCVNGVCKHSLFNLAEALGKGGQLEGGVGSAAKRGGKEGGVVHR